MLRPAPTKQLQSATTWMAKNLFNRQWKAAQTEGTSSAGGYAVSDETASLVHRAVSEHGIAQRVAKPFPMQSDKLSIAKWDASVTVDLPGEATAISPSDKTYGVITLTSVKRSVLTEISNELVSDSLPDVVTDLVEEAGYALATKQDDDLINGDGTSAYGNVTGLVSRLGAGGTTTASGTNFGTVTLANLQAVAANLSSQFYRHSQLSWIMGHKFFAEYCVPLCSTVGLDTWQMVDGNSEPMLLGYPVHLTDAMPNENASAAACFFGNWTACIAYGEKLGGLDWQASRTSAGAFGIDLTVLRCNLRYDIQVHEYPDGSNPSSFSGLKLAAA